MTPKTAVYVILLSTPLILSGEAPVLAARVSSFGFRVGTGLMWAPEDKKNLDGKSLYRQNFPFFAEFFCGRAIKGVLSVSHFFSQEREHMEVDSLGEETRFTPKLRQYAVQLGVKAGQHLTPWLQIHGGLGAGIFWRSYNPGWKEKSYWDKARLSGLGQGLVEAKLGPKAWLGLGWRYYAVGWRKEARWTRGEFNRMRRMSVLCLTMSYYPGSW
jgi:hypothetical protein